MTPEESYEQAINGGVTPEAAEEAGEEITPNAPAAEAPEIVEETPAPVETPAPRTNPNWDEAWKDVPDPIKAAQRAVFEKWDNSYNHLEVRHRPWSAFEEAGVAPEQVEFALSLQNQLVEDPRAFVDTLIKHFGFEPLQAAQAVAAATNPTEPDPFADPQQQRIDELERWRNEEIQNRQRQAEAQQQEQRRNQQLQQIETDLTELHNRVGSFPDNEVIERAMLNATVGKNPGLEFAYYELRTKRDADEAAFRARTAPPASPSVLGGGGAPAVASPPVERKIESNEDLRARALSLAQSMADATN